MDKFIIWAADDCQLVADASVRQVRSVDTRTLVVSRTRSSFGDRTFAAARAQVRNSLPPNLRQCGLSYGQFRRLLKTFLFGQWGHVVLSKLRRIEIFLLTYLLTYIVIYLICNFTSGCKSAFRTPPWWGACGRLLLMRFLSISIRALRRLELVMCIGGRYSVVVGTGRINPRFLQLISICHVTSSFGSLLVLSSLIYDCVTSARQQQPVGCCFDAACLFVCLLQNGYSYRTETFRIYRHLYWNYAVKCCAELGKVATPSEYKWIAARMWWFALLV